MPAEKVLFIDTNIWLDFYRALGTLFPKTLRCALAMCPERIVSHSENASERIFLEIGPVKSGPRNESLVMSRSVRIKRHRGLGRQAITE
jgi:hypothetical protein